MENNNRINDNGQIPGITLNITTDPTMMPYIGGGETDGIDDFQFMDALLDNDATFSAGVVDSHAELGTQPTTTTSPVAGPLSTTTTVASAPGTTTTTTTTAPVVHPTLATAPASLATATAAGVGLAHPPQLTFTTAPVTSNVPLATAPQQIIAIAQQQQQQQQIIQTQTAQLATHAAPLGQTTAAGTIQAPAPLALRAPGPTPTQPQQPHHHQQHHAAVLAAATIKKPDPGGQLITPSPLTARLNYPLTHFPAVPMSTAAAAAPTVATATAHHPHHTHHHQQQQQPPLQLQQQAQPQQHPHHHHTPASHTTLASTRRGTPIPGRKRGRETLAVSEDEDERNRRRMDRNLREQQRSHRITEQINHLKDVLATANVHFKPDKYSTLVSVVEYIKQLQSRSTLLDEEHKKLLDTISKTNEMVNKPYYQTTADGEEMSVSNDLLSDIPARSVLEDEHAVFVQNLDYKNVFQHCGVALAVASIDGRFMECNPEFEALTGYQRDELLPMESESAPNPQESVVVVPATATSNDDVASVQGSVTSTTGSEQAGGDSSNGSKKAKNLSLFNLLAREDMEQIFLAMSRMLKNPLAPGGNGGGDTSSASDGGTTSGNGAPYPDFWNGKVSQSRRKDCKVRMNVSLVRNPQGRPRFFQCALTPCEED